jgi:two-component system phosphate regulon sensor histidine kinase PhoR
MQITSPKQMSVLISTITSAIVLLVFWWAYPHGKNSEDVLLGVAIALVTFMVVFIIIYYLLNQLIFEKITPIYKTIQKLNLSDSELKEFLEGKDIGKELEEELTQWAAKRGNELTRLREMEKYRKEFLGNVSHELKTPIFNIQGYISTLLDGGLEDQTINRVYLERAERSINRMISIVQDLESISRLEAGELKITCEKFNVVALVQEIVDSLEMKAAARNIKIEIARSKDTPIYVSADRMRISQVFVNLIVNSINYGKDGGTTIVSFSDMFDHVLVEVSDDGAGIEQKDLNRIFERFFRADKSRSRDTGGTGLGLAIVKHIIEAHRQTINVRSKVGEGSSFVFTLNKA